MTHLYLVPDNARLAQPERRNPYDLYDDSVEPELPTPPDTADLVLSRAYAPTTPNYQLEEDDEEFDRTIVIMHARGASFTEIARAIGKPRSTIYDHYRAAMRDFHARRVDWMVEVQLGQHAILSESQERSIQRAQIAPELAEQSAAEKDIVAASRAISGNAGVTGNSRIDVFAHQELPGDEAEDAGTETVENVETIVGLLGKAGVMLPAGESGEDDVVDAELVPRHVAPTAPGSDEAISVEEQPTNDEPDDDDLIGDWIDGKFVLRDPD